MTSRFHVFHTPQPSGEYVAMCESLPDWFCWGDTLAESEARAEWSLRDHLLGHVNVTHFHIPTANAMLRSAA